MTTARQQVPYFGTPTNFASLSKMRLLRRRVGRVNAERVAAWYVHMRDLAKQGTTFGQFTTNAVLFAESLGVDVPDANPALDAWMGEAAAIWDGFQAVELIDVDGDVRCADSLFRVTVLDYEETNTSRPSRVTSSRDVTPMSPAERKAKGRENARRRDAGMPEMSPSEAESWLMSRRVTSRVTPVTSRHAIGDIQDETDETNHPLPPAVAVTEVAEANAASASVDLPPSQRTPEARIRQAERDLAGGPDKYVRLLIMRHNGSSDKTLAPADEFRRYWKPACDLLAEHGLVRLAEATRAPGAATAGSVQYVKKILDRMKLDEAARALSQTTNPDVGSGDWDHLESKGA